MGVQIINFLIEQKLEEKKIFALDLNLKLSEKDEIVSQLQSSNMTQFAKSTNNFSKQNLNNNIEKLFEDKKQTEIQIKKQEIKIDNIELQISELQSISQIVESKFSEK